MRLHFIPLSIIAALPYISIMAAFSYIFNMAAQKCCVLYRPVIMLIKNSTSFSVEARMSSSVARVSSLILYCRICE